jgi:gag-polyprotein putative aspartyl protease
VRTMLALASARPSFAAPRRLRLGLAASTPPRRPLLAEAYDARADALRQMGALIPITVGPAAAVAAGLRQRGEEPPPSRQLSALIDTGASITGISVPVAQEMRLVQTGTTTIGGVTGSSQQPVYAAAIDVKGVSLDPITIAGLNFGGGFDVLIGRDILRSTVLTYDGIRGDVSFGQILGNAPGGAPFGVKILGGVLAAGTLAGILYALFGRRRA